MIKEMITVLMAIQGAKGDKEGRSQGRMIKVKSGGGIGS